MVDGFQMMRKSFLMAAVACSCAAVAEDGGQTGNSSPWHFRVGPVMAPRVRVRIHCPSQMSPLSSLTLPGGTALSGKSGDVAADPSAGYVERKYSDGHVGPDEGTDDPKSMIKGLTWNWGAKNVAAQHVGGKMEFHTEMARWSDSVSYSSYGTEGSGFDGDRDILLGFEAMGGWTFFENDNFDAAVDLGFRFYGCGNLKSKSRYGASVTTTHEEYRYVDSYDASGWSGAVPSGAFEGTPGGPGRLIGATPTRREELLSSTSTTRSQHYSAYTKLNYSIWDLRLGPTVGWKAMNRLTIRGGLYGLLGLVDARLRTSVDASSGSYTSRKSACEGVFGMAAGLSAQIDLTDRIFLVGGAEYDWWADSVHLQAGGADARIKLSDVSISLAVGMEF